MNNPPAFPSQSVYIEDQETNSRGMTLRDYFAARAMQSYMSRQLIDGFDEDVISEMAYKVANAMLIARQA